MKYIFYESIKGVTDGCPVDKGRNIISVGRDGQCKLFDVGESKCLTTFAKYDTIINACAIQILTNSNLQKLELNPTDQETTSM